MSESTMETLKKAHELIEADELEQARVLLEPLLESDPDNPDVWWVYAHAVKDPEVGRNAITRVSKIDQAYPGVSDLTDQVVEEGMIDDFTEELDEIAVTTNDSVSEKVDLESAGTGGTVVEKTSSRSQLGRLVAVAIIILFLVVMAGIFLNRDDSSDDPTLTVVAATTAEPIASGDNTEEPTIQSDETRLPAPGGRGTESDEQPTGESIPTETGEDPTETSSGSVNPTEEQKPTDAPTDEPMAEITLSQLVVNELPNIELYSNGIEKTNSEMGETTLVAVCAGGGGKTSRETLSDIMNVIVSQVDSIPQDSDAVGVRLMSCEDERIINLIAVPVEAVQSFKDGSLSEREFLSQWRAIQPF